MITIFGANGKVGSTAAKALCQRGFAVRAVVRDLSKGTSLLEIGCGLFLADLNDGPSIERALHGAEGALLICPLLPTADDVAADAQRILERVARALERTAKAKLQPKRPEGTERTAKAKLQPKRPEDTERTAKAKLQPKRPEDTEGTRLRHVVAISDYGAHHPAGTGLTTIFHALEQRWGQTGVPTTFLRSAEHLQNWARFLPLARERGELPSFHHPVTRPLPVVSAHDVGTVAAEILAEGPGEGTRVIHVEGPRRYSAEQIAHALGQKVGRPVSARELPQAHWERALVAGGLGHSYARLTAELQEAHNAGRIEVEPGGEVRYGTTGVESIQF